jgi:hypothetical protein
VRPSPDYELVQGLGYYKLYTEAATWDEARETCIREGTHLLILNSGAEMDAVKSIWAERPNVSGSSWPNYIHVGVHDRFKEGQYVTILGKEHCHRTSPSSASYSARPMFESRPGSLTEATHNFYSMEILDYYLRLPQLLPS